MIEALASELTLQNMLSFAAFLVIGGVGIYYAAKFMNKQIDARDEVIMRKDEELKQERLYARESDQTLHEVHLKTLSLNQQVVATLEKHGERIDRLSDTVAKCEVR